MIRRRPVAGIAAQNDEDDSLDESTINDDTMSTPLELSIACLRVGCDTDRSRKTATGGRNSKDDHLSFKVVAACCVIKELDLAIKKAEIKVGANPVDQPGTTGTTASVRLNGPGLA